MLWDESFFSFLVLPVHKNVCVLPMGACYSQTEGNLVMLEVILQCINNSFFLSTERTESVSLHSALVLNKVCLSISTFRHLSQVKSVWNQPSLLCSSSSSSGGGREGSIGCCQ